MTEKNRDPVLKRIKKKLERAKKSRYSVLIYIATVFLISVWLILDICLMTIIVPILAVLAPYKLYQEKNIKKIVVVGVVVILLISVTGSIYQLGIIFEKSPQRLSSYPLSDGRLDSLYGDQDTEFQFDVNLSKDYVRGIEDDFVLENFTVYTNLTVSTAEGFRVQDYEGFEMDRVSLFTMNRTDVELEHNTTISENDKLWEALQNKMEEIENDLRLYNETEETGLWWIRDEEGEDKYSIELNEEEMAVYDETVEEYHYSRVVSGLDEELFSHRFSIKRNRTHIETNESYEDWKRTSHAFGPITLSERSAFQRMMYQYSFSTMIIFLFVIGLLWVKREMDKSVSESTEGLEEKEKELDEYCPECGTLLKGETVCEECGWEIGAKEEPDNFDSKETD